MSDQTSDHDLHNGGHASPGQGTLRDRIAERVATVLSWGPDGKYTAPNLVTLVMAEVQPEFDQQADTIRDLRERAERAEQRVRELEAAIAEHCAEAARMESEREPSLMERFDHVNELLQLRAYRQQIGP